MARDFLVLCGGVGLPARGRRWREASRVQLRLGRGTRDVHLRLEHLSQQLCANLPEVATDLLEIAAYVYAADQAASRSGLKEFEYGDRWRRHFRFDIPVRRLDVWRRPEVAGTLADALSFLTDDDYEFRFTQVRQPTVLEHYLFAAAAPEEAEDIQEVMLFSGGLDSLGGAVQEILQGQRRVALVSHRPVSKVYARQRDLAKALAERVAKTRLKPLHVAVEVNKGKSLTRDFTQRSRSFLFAAVAAVVARALGLHRVRFYENGVISLNLPISLQVLGGRASRTTHPQTLAGFERLLSLVFACHFTVENPFLWKTKADVLREIKAAGQGELCAMTSSCTHTIEATLQHTHCGRCSQCVDRRLNALAANLDATEDPPLHYASDVLTGARDGAELTLIERYYATALKVERMQSVADFVAEFAETSRVLRFLGVPPVQAAERVFNLHKRGATQVIRAVVAAVDEESKETGHRNLPHRCLLRLACGSSVRPTTTAEPNGRVAPPAAATRFQLNAETFEACFRGNACFLGNTMEYRLLERLSRSLGIFVTYADLREEVWDNDHTEDNTIQRTVSNLRRKLRESGMGEISIDGRQQGHYRLLIPS
jgi:7-cyano-7-deazaguanine synthase in queuosine biosynthesis